MLTPYYNSIISVREMLESNQTSILRDKVNRNQYLVFKGSYGDFNLVFNTFKSDDDQDRLFYQQLFKYYNKYILEFNAIKLYGDIVIDGRNDREDLVNQIIHVKCLPALQILVQDYQYQLTDSNLSIIINRGALKFMKFIKQQQQQNQLPFKKNIIQLLLENAPTLNSFKSLNWLQNENIIDIAATTTSEIISQYAKVIKYQINEIIPLKMLITICKVISLSTLSSGETNFNEIESFSNSITKQELALPLSDGSNQIQHKKEFILKLLDLFHSGCNFRYKTDYYYLYFKCNGSDYGQDSKECVLFNMDGSSAQNQLKQSFQFANFTLFKHSFRNGVSFSNIYDLLADLRISTPESTSVIFSHCSGENNKEKRLKFIDSMINEQKLEYNASVPSLFRILLFLIDYDDIELIKHFSLELVIHESSILMVGGTFSLVQFVKSISMLDYLFTSYKHLLSFVDVWGFKSLQLFQHYESIIFSDKSTSLPMIIESPPTQTLMDYSLNKALPDLIEYIIGSGQQIYKFKIDFMFKSITFHIKNENRKFEILKSFFTCHHLYQETTVYYLGFQLTIGFNKFSDWLYNQYQDNLKVRYTHNHESIYYKENGIPNLFYYNTGRFDEISDISILNLLKCVESIKNIGQLDFICKKLKSSTPTLNEILIFFEELSNIVKNGALQLFEFIQHHHPWILNPPTKSKNKSEDVVTTPLTPSSLFSMKQLKQLLFYSLGHGHLLLSEFFFEFISITKLEFQTHSNEISRVYFNKKFK